MVVTEPPLEAAAVLLVPERGGAVWALLEDEEVMGGVVGWEEGVVGGA